KGDRGEKGDKGDTGASLSVKGAVDDVSALPEEGREGDGYMVGDDLYVRNGAEWVNVGRIKGEKGDPGERGEKGDSPSLTISDGGTWVVDGTDTGKKAMGPKGDKGDPGETGPRGLPLRYDAMTQEEKTELASLIPAEVLRNYATKAELDEKIDSSLITDTFIADEEKGKILSQKGGFGLYKQFFYLNERATAIEQTANDAKLYAEVATVHAVEDSLPKPGEEMENAICFLRKKTGSEADRLLAYVWDGGKWGVCGSTNDLTDELLQKLEHMKESVVLSQAEYDALSEEQQNDENKLYFLKV
ncbi:MAG: hypothetical protein SOW18_06795, partial [Peptoniphilus sp.]|nr:hypothetical protein [Peptoniphilus sp.]